MNRPTTWTLQEQIIAITDELERMDYEGESETDRDRYNALILERRALQDNLAANLK